MLEQNRQSLSPDTAKQVPFPENSSVAKYIRSFNELSSGDTELVGGKAVSLGLLARAGLSVPSGYAITSEAFDYFLEKGVLPSGLADFVIKSKKVLGDRIAIRSSANCEDGQNLSMAGVFNTHYVTEDADIENSIKNIYDQSKSQEVGNFAALHDLNPKDIKMGLVIQELITPDIAGVVYTGVNGDKTLVQYTEGFGDKLVDGKTHGSTVLVDRDGNILESTGFELLPIKPEVIRGLSAASEIIIRIFGDGAQDIEFAVQDGETFLLQARALTADLGKIELAETAEDVLLATKTKLKRLVLAEKKELGTNNVIFSNSNFIELLPNPTEMDFGIFSYIFTGSDGIPGGIQVGRIEMGYPLDEKSVGYTHYIGGKPYFSIAKDAATFYIGIPTPVESYFSTLVQEYLNSVQSNTEKGVYPEMGLYLQDPSIEDLRERFGSRGEDYFKVYKLFTTRMAGYADSFQAEFERQNYPELKRFTLDMKEKLQVDMTPGDLVKFVISVLEHLRTRSCVDFVKSARLGFYYSKRLQSELRSKFDMTDAQVEQSFARLSQGLEGSEITTVNSRLVNAPLEEAMRIASKLIGHYSSGEMLQVRHTRLKDDPEALQSYVYGLRQNGTYNKSFEKQKQERLGTEKSLLEGLGPEDRINFEQILHAAQKYMALRETIKYQFAQEYDLIHDALELLGRKIGLGRGDIYFVYPRELPKLIENPEAFVHIIRSRKQAFANYSLLNLPPIIRESDIDSLELKANLNNEFTEATGKFLAEGEALEGVIVNLDELSSEEIEAAIRRYKESSINVILVAVQMNLSHDPYIMAADGLIIENAGIVSHGAQRARELGRGAIGGIKVTPLKTGTRVYFDPMSKTVKKLANSKIM